MTGKRWRLTALIAGLIVAVFVVCLWWITEDPFLAVLALAIVVMWGVLWAMDVEEKPQCRAELPPPTVNYADHAIHHCRLDLGHAETRCECRCGLVAFPPKVPTGAGTVQVVLDSVRRAA